MSTVLERAKAVQLDTANQTSIWIRLRLLQELIAEIERLELLVRADELGFYAYHLAEHHVTPLSVAPSPTVFLAAAARINNQPEDARYCHDCN